MGTRVVLRRVWIGIALGVALCLAGLAAVHGGQVPLPAATGLAPAVVERPAGDLLDHGRPAHPSILPAVQQAAVADDAADREAEPRRGLGAWLLSAVSERVEEVSGRLGEAGAGLLAVPGLLAEVGQRAQDPEHLRVWGEMAVKVMLVLLAGFLAAWLTRRLLAGPRRAVAVPTTDNLVFRALYLAVRAILDLIPIAAFAAAAYGLLPLTEPRYVTQLVALTLVNANVLARVILTVARFVLAPDAPGLRLLRLDDETVHYLYIWIRRVVGLGVYGYFVLEAALLMGMYEGLHGFLMTFLGLAITAMAVVLVLQNRTDVADLLRGASPAPRPRGADDAADTAAEAAHTISARAITVFRQRLADFWHVVVIALVLALFVTWALEVEGGLRFLAQAIVMTAIVIMLANLLIRTTRRGVDRLFGISDELRTAYPALEARANRYRPVIDKTLTGVIVAIAALAVFQAWGLGALSWLFSPEGIAIVGELLAMVLIVAAALVLWEIVSAIIEQSLAREAADDKGSTRKLTLLPLLRNVVRITIVLIASMIVLSQLGINIGPLLAGAGVIGLAIGFGAQTLVRDVITGAFILMEDAIAVGDWIEAGGHSGTVEYLTVRTVTMRDLNGTVHVVPFGDVTTVMNYNRGYGYAVIDAGVAYREDYGEVVQALQDVATELRNDETWGPDIMGDLEVFGMNNLSDSAVEIRVRIKTKPMRQFAVRRSFLQRMKRVFDERDIEIPFPHRTIWFGTGKDGGAPPVRVAEAPQQALEPPPGSGPSQERPAPEPEVHLASESEATEDVMREKERAEAEQAAEESEGYKDSGGTPEREK